MPSLVHRLPRAAVGQVQRSQALLVFEVGVCVQPEHLSNNGLLVVRDSEVEGSHLSPLHAQVKGAFGSTIGRAVIPGRL